MSPERSGVEERKTAGISPDDVDIVSKTGTLGHFYEASTTSISEGTAHIMKNDDAAILTDLDNPELIEFSKSILKGGKNFWGADSEIERDHCIPLLNSIFRKFDTALDERNDYEVPYVTTVVKLVRDSFDDIYAMIGKKGEGGVYTIREDGDINNTLLSAPHRTIQSDDGKLLFGAIPLTEGDKLFIVPPLVNDYMSKHKLRWDNSQKPSEVLAGLISRISEDVHEKNPDLKCVLIDLQHKNEALQEESPKPSLDETWSALLEQEDTVEIINKEWATLLLEMEEYPEALVDSQGNTMSGKDLADKIRYDIRLNARSIIDGDEKRRLNMITNRINHWRDRVRNLLERQLTLTDKRSE